MNLGLDLSMRLQQKLSFQMIQSLKLLQVNTLQLEQLLKTELEMNPVLEASDELPRRNRRRRKRRNYPGRACGKGQMKKELEVNEDQI